MNENPYSPPNPAPDTMPATDDGPVSPELLKLAAALLERRERPFGIGYYWRHSWKRKVLSLLILAGAVIMLVGTEMYLGAIWLVGFGVGSHLRDFQWWRLLVRSWGPTAELIDWGKVRRLALQAKNLL